MVGFGFEFVFLGRGFLVRGVVNVETYIVLVVGNVVSDGQHLRKGGEGGVSERRAWACGLGRGGARTKVVAKAAFANTTKSMPKPFL